MWYHNKPMNLLMHVVIIVASGLTLDSKPLGQDHLKSGQRLNHNEYLTSSDKRFYLRMQDDGNHVIYKGSTFDPPSTIWSSNTSGKGTSPHRLEMQPDGNLVIYDDHGAATWASNTHGQNAVDAYLIMQSDGNAVIYNSSPKTAIWASNTAGSSGVDCRHANTWPRDWTKFEKQVLALVNQNRAKGAYCGSSWKPPLSQINQNEKLTRAARCHAADMGIHDYFSHRDKQGDNMSKRIIETGYNFRSVAENIAKGQKSPKEVVESWMKSPGHCNAIMGDYQDIGIGYIGINNYRGGRKWVQNFGTPL